MDARRSIPTIDIHIQTFGLYNEMSDKRHDTDLIQSVKKKQQQQ